MIPVVDIFAGPKTDMQTAGSTPAVPTDITGCLGTKHILTRRFPQRPKKGRAFPKDSASGCSLEQRPAGKPTGLPATFLIIMKRATGQDQLH